MTTTAKLSIKTKGMRIGDVVYTRKPALYTAIKSDDNLLSPTLSHVRQKWSITEINGPDEAIGILINEKDVFMNPTFISV